MRCEYQSNGLKARISTWSPAHRDTYLMESLWTRLQAMLHGVHIARYLYWEKLNRGVSKPGCFPLFSGKVQIVSRTLSGLFLVGALNRLRKRKRDASGKSPDHPRANRKNPGKIGKVPERTKKDKKGRTRPDQEPPLLKHPRLAALDCSDSIGKLFRACFNGESHNYGAICCKMGSRTEVPVWS